MSIDRFVGFEASWTSSSDRDEVPLILGDQTWFRLVTRDEKDPLELKSRDGSGLARHRSANWIIGQLDIAKTKRLAFAAVRGGQDQMYTRKLAEPEAVLLPGAEGTTPIVFSPNGEWLLVSDGEELRRVPLAGGPVTRVALATNLGADWGPDDTVVVGGNGGLVHTSAGGGNLGLWTSVDGAGGFYCSPKFLPSGRAVQFYIVHSTEPHRVAVYDRQTEETKILVQGSSPQLTRSGHLLFYRDGSLWAVPFDLDRLEIRSEALPVVDEVEVNVLGAASYSVADNGTLLYRRVRPIRFGSTLVSVDRSGRETPLAGDWAPDRYFYPCFSPDGRRAAVAVSDPGSGGADIWVLDLTTGTRSRITQGGLNMFFPVWSPDGRALVFSDGVGPDDRLQTAAADGTGTVETLFPDVGQLFPSSWAADGLALAGHRNVGGSGGRDLWVLRLVGDHKLSEFLSTPAREVAAAFSPNGKWLAYVSNESGTEEVYVRSYPRSGKEQTISTDGGTEPVWSRDGRELFYRNGDRVLVVAVETGNDLRAGTPREPFTAVYEADPSSARAVADYDVSPDGERFVFVKSGAESDGSGGASTIVLNWFEELERLVPTD